MSFPARSVPLAVPTNVFLLGSSHEMDLPCCDKRLVQVSFWVNLPELQYQMYTFEIFHIQYSTDIVLYVYKVLTITLYFIYSI